MFLLASMLLTACGGSDGEETTLYIGGSFALTGAYAEDTAAVLAGFQDYARYVNDNHKLAPWLNDKFDENIKLEVLWRDDELKPEKALSIYDEFKDKMYVYRASGSQTALPLMDLLAEDQMGATTLVSGPYLLTPPKTIFTQYPLYTDELAAIADWFLDNWDQERKPRVAYLTADSASGRSIDTPEMEQYLKDAGYEFVGKQFVPMVPTSPPTTQLAWLKENNVDLVLGWMINPGSQPTIKEAVRLGMGPHLDYKITFGFAAPSHLAVFAPAMGTTGDGVVVAGSYPPFTHTDVEGIKFANSLQETYRPDDRVGHIMYLHGIIEAMIQVEALRLALVDTDVSELTPALVLHNGFEKIKNFSTGDLTPPLTFGPGDVEGVDEIRLDTVKNGEVEFIGYYPCKHVYS